MRLNLKYNTVGIDILVWSIIASIPVLNYVQVDVLQDL